MNVAIRSYTVISLRAIKGRTGTILTLILNFTNMATEEILYLCVKED
jgi:hypothetical protein